jgi:arylsulfatase A-like enzyme
MRTTNTIIKLFAIVLITATGLSLESAGGAYPRKFGAREIIPVEGVSLRPAFSGKSLERSDALYFEHHLNCAIRDGDWKLYNVKVDRGELQNVADKNPEKVAELLAKWEKWAVRAKVQPWPYKTK